MRKITFWIDTGFAGCNYEETIEFDDNTTDKRQKICKQLYQQDTNKYINCNTKDIDESIKLIKDITNDR